MRFVSQFDLERANLTKELEEVFEKDGYNFNSVLDTDVLNPVDSYNLIKRTARTWVKVKDAFKAKEQIMNEKESEIIFEHLHSVLKTFPSWEKNRCYTAVINVIILEPQEPFAPTLMRLFISC